MAIEEIRFKNLVRVNSDEEFIDLEDYGLGDVRTLEEFEKFSGIDFKNKKLSDDISKGNFVV